MNVDSAPEVARRRSVGIAAAGGLTYGLLVVGCLGVVFAHLAEYQVPDGDDPDQAVGMYGALLAGMVAFVLCRVVNRLAGRFSAQWPPVPGVLPLFAPSAVTLPFIFGLERNRLETGVAWSVAVVLVHVLYAVASTGADRRRWARAGIAGTLVIAVVVTWGCQHRWRAQKFELTGQPLYVPAVPGYELAGTYAGRLGVRMVLQGKPPHHPRSDRIDVSIVRALGEFGRCQGGGRGERWVVPSRPDAGESPSQAGGQAPGMAFCLPEGAVLVLSPGYRSPAIEHLLAAVTVTKVTGSVLADYPDGSTEREAD